MFKRLIHYTSILACTAIVLASQIASAQAMDSVASVLAKATQVAAGNLTTCTLTTSGGVKCWGDNSYGQLGDGTTVDKSTPADVSGLTSGVSTIAVGYAHTCAVTTNGGVKCWGRNSSGQLGNGTMVGTSTPVDVSGLTSGVRAIVTGDLHTCALTTGGGVKCWGNKSAGQLGDGTVGGNTSTPVNVSGLTSGTRAIAASGAHTCALTTGGGVKCWGANQYGQLGDGTKENKRTPADVSGLTSGVSAIVAGSGNTCAVTTGGGMKCWGANQYGQLGDGTTVDKSTPVNVSGLTSGVIAIAVGDRHACAVTVGGGIKCWGENSYAQLGDGTTMVRLTPVDVSGLTSGVSTIAAGFAHTCAVTTGGGVKCWGDNFWGELGDGTKTDKPTPVDVTGFGSEVIAINYFAPTPVNGPAQINVAAGYGKSVAVQSFTQGAHGTVACTTVGICTYTPQTDYAGLDGFQYTVNVSALNDLQSVAGIDSTANIESLTAVVTGSIGIFVYRSRVALPLIRK